MRTFAIGVCLLLCLSGCAAGNPIRPDVDVQFGVDPQTRKMSGQVVISYRP
jgi:hypothetical protein